MATHVQALLKFASDYLDDPEDALKQVMSNETEIEILVQNLQVWSEEEE